MIGKDSWKQQALHHRDRADRLQRELDELKEKTGDLTENVEDDGMQLAALLEKNRRQGEMIESLRRTNDDLRIDVTALTVWRQKVARVLRNSLEEIQELVEDG